MPDRFSKSPQEKKALSLKRDCRNVYGESTKAARVSIPLRKAIENRRTRHKANQLVSLVDRLNEAEVDLVESSVRQDVFRVGGWTKSPDAPLEEVIPRDQERRKNSVGRKTRTREATFRPVESDSPSKD